MKYFKNLFALLLVIVIALAMLAAVIYFIVFPFLLASKAHTAGTFEIKYGTFFFILILLANIEFIYITFANTYNFNRRTLFLLTIIHGQREGNEGLEKKLQGKRMFITMTFSYLLVVYTFAIVYLFLGNFFPGSFNTSITLIDSIYLSFTAISVGPAGIEPVSALVKIMIMVEILIGLSYTILLFSVVSSFLLEKRKTEEK